MALLFVGTLAAGAAWAAAYGRTSFARGTAAPAWVARLKPPWPVAESGRILLADMRGKEIQHAEVEVLAAEAHQLDLQWLRQRLREALGHVPRPVSSLVVAVVGEERMSALNLRHRGEARSTDVLAFEHSAAREPLEADIVVCADEAERQATQHGHRAEQELLLYALHGVLHCAGFDDHDEDHSAAMHAEEDRILCAIGVGPTFARGSRRPGPDLEPGGA